MAPKLFRRRKGANASNTPLASAAICSSSSSEKRSMSFSSSSRAIDRSTSQLVDSRRVNIASPSSSRFPSTSASPSDQQSSTKNTTADIVALESSSRFLLDDIAPFFGSFASITPAPAPLTIEMPRPQSPRVVDESPVVEESQVVVLKVSLHCKGCADKVWKHINKMEGVKSFSVDLASKKVSVAGDVTPLGVLNSISKVKHAHICPSPVKSQPSESENHHDLKLKSKETCDC